MSDTLIMIKGHAKSHAEEILAMAGAVGLEVVERIEGRLASWAIKEFYGEHEGRPYFPNLVRSVSGPVVAVRARTRIAMTDRKPAEGSFLARASGLDAPLRWRLILGATDPTKAEPGTVRAAFGNKEPGMMHENAAHGSDGVTSAARELALLMNPAAWLAA